MLQVARVEAEVLQPEQLRMARMDPARMVARHRLVEATEAMEATGSLLLVRRVQGLEAEAEVLSVAVASQRMAAMAPMVGSLLPTIRLPMSTVRA